MYTQVFNSPLNPPILGDARILVPKCRETREVPVPPILGEPGELNAEIIRLQFALQEVLQAQPACYPTKLGQSETQNHKEHWVLKPDIIVIGASAGGLKAFETIVSQLPSNFPAAVFIVWHISPDYPSILPEILARFTPLRVKHASGKEPIRPGHIYIAPPDFHMLVEWGYVRLSRGPKENRFRPAIDVLFRSAAVSYAERVIGVVLTGSLDDGAAGLYAIKERGGIAVVQDPSDALHPSMPRAAMKAAKVDYCVPIREMGALLAHLVNKAIPVQEVNPVSEKMDVEVGIAREDNGLAMGIMKLGELSPYTCPECHGVLLQLKEGSLLRFRCHTGHAYSLNTLLAEVTQSIEESLWDGIRTIEASEMLMLHTAKHLRELNEHEAADLLLQKAEDAKRRANLVRQAVMSNEILSQDTINEEVKSVEIKGSGIIGKGKVSAD